MLKHDLTNLKFGDWTVLSFSHLSQSNNSYWLCRCKCGAQKTVESYNLRLGRSTKCVCCSAKSSVGAKKRDKKGRLMTEAIKVSASREETDQAHASDPKIGDYWHEMFTPILVVLGRPSSTEVLICRKKKALDDGWTWDFSGIETLSLADFRAYLSYKSPEMAHKFWCTCLPEHMVWAREAAIAATFGSPGSSCPPSEG
jgi:hypothetical protein